TRSSCPGHRSALPCLISLSPSLTNRVTPRLTRLDDDGADLIGRHEPNTPGHGLLGAPRRLIVRPARRYQDRAGPKERPRVRLKGKTALIPGASRNIGRAIALAFAAEGADLALNTRVNRDELEAVAAECAKAGVRAVPVLGDIADASVAEAMVK